MTSIDRLSDQTLINAIKKSENLEISSFSLKILLGQLKVKIDLANNQQTISECVNKLKEYFKKYCNLPNVKSDLKNLFGLDI